MQSDAQPDALGCGVLLVVTVERSDKKVGELVDQDALGNLWMNQNENSVTAIFVVIPGGPDIVERPLQRCVKSSPNDYAVAVVPRRVTEPLHIYDEDRTMHRSVFHFTRMPLIMSQVYGLDVLRFRRLAVGLIGLERFSGQTLVEHSASLVGFWRQWSGCCGDVQLDGVAGLEDGDGGGGVMTVAVPVLGGGGGCRSRYGSIR